MELKALGIKPQKEQQFAKKGIFTAEDLAAYLPTGYRDFTHETGILPEDEVSCIVIKTSRISANAGGRVPYIRVEGTVHPTEEPITVVWFQQSFLYKKLMPKMGMAFYAAGKISNDPKWGYSMKSPELFEPLSPGARKIYPTYRKIPGMSLDYLIEKIQMALTMPEATKETLPATVVEDNNLLSHKEALFYLHQPKTMQQIEKGRERVLFDDLLYFGLHNEWAKRQSVPVSPVVVMHTEKVEQVRASLPYTLTADQDAVLTAMLADAKAYRRINALLQGDVGCGKTIVAILLMVAMAENGYQSVMMAPTQVLARQHYEELQRVVGPFGVRVAFLGAELGKKDRAKTLKAIQMGEVDIVVGTHSVIGKAVEYKKLACVIADEEHKFGVAQRAALVEKAADGVHTVTMSATPIPRTLAQVIYGSVLQLYTIHTLPEGRKPVLTGVATSRDKLYRCIVREAQAGHQTYVVCPLIDPSDKLEGVKSVEEVRKDYEKDLAPHGIRIATLTGRDGKEETEKTVQALKDGDLDVLIATTVVEVGVNIPTASMMVVSNAERFGLASLHQLRGRVGRSDIQSYCVLDCYGAKGKSVQRLQAMCATTDGFQIAKEDLAIRGAGDFLGTRQSGDNKYMTLMLAFPEEYEKAKKIAKDLLDNEARCPLMQQVRVEREEVERKD